jgi:hypothetical protein
MNASSKKNNKKKNVSYIHILYTLLNNKQALIYIS